jgi:rhodanese-related sulfurtransferase
MTGTYGLLEPDARTEETGLPPHISREDLVHRMTNRQHPILVESLGAGYYNDAHLPGAINIPPGQVDTLAPTLLPDAHAQIVVYGTGAGASSDAVARRLEELGYRAVSVYAGGKEDWVEHGLPLERLDDEHHEPFTDAEPLERRVTGRRKGDGVRSP